MLNYPSPNLASVAHHPKGIGPVRQAILTRGTIAGTLRNGVRC